MDAGIIAVIVIICTLVATLVLLYTLWRYRQRGTLQHITTSSVAYDRERYGHILNWDRHSLSIHGRRTLLYSGEFHYWRLPDRSRWESVLKKYKAAGLNCVRIYFHWGFHSPREGVYLFDGNRDVEYLLKLCKELGLWVLAAPGPYLCAETNAGGFPSWLMAKPNILVRHYAFFPFGKRYDPEFTRYSCEWLQAILSILSRHQITRGGPVLGLQLENELFEILFGIIPFGLCDEMRVLAQCARECEIEVPLFHNDGFENASFIARPELDRKKSWFWRRGFGLDWYGFDKYTVWVPTSDIKSHLIGNELTPDKWPEWDPKVVEQGFDKMETTVRGYGSAAAESPIFIPELQGGWFNHYRLPNSYDDIYSYYGSTFTRLIFDTVSSQGCTMLSYYMVYGGTNWGSLGDPDVYTSYDYSACVREYGYTSDRAGHLRLGILFARSFSEHFARTDRVSSNVQTVPNVITTQRESENKVRFTFLRNFNRSRPAQFSVHVALTSGLGNKRALELPCHLPYKRSFIALGNYVTSNNLALVFSTLPVHARMRSREKVEGIGEVEVWIVEANPNGAMAFEGEVNVEGSMQPKVKKQEDISIVQFDKEVGYTRFTTPTGTLYLLGLDHPSLMTLHAHFDPEQMDDLPQFLAWGAHCIYSTNNELEIKYTPDQHSLSLLTFTATPAANDGNDEIFSPDPELSFLYKKRLGKPPLTIGSDVVLTDWKEQVVDFGSMPWTPLTFHGHKPVDNAISLCYTSGHSLYHCRFTPSPNKPVKLRLNVRHRATVYANGKLVGGHTTYSRQLFFAGAKIGPDPSFCGATTYELTPYLQEGENDLFIIVDSFGMSRQAFVMNDAKNPRGLLSAKLTNVQNALWEVAGRDVRKLEHPYNSTGFPDEFAEKNWKECPGLLVEKDRVRWLEFTFRHPISLAAIEDPSHDAEVPLRLQLKGKFTAVIFLNGVLVGRYYGNGDASQRDFYLMEGLVQPNGEENKVRILVYAWEEVRDPLVRICGWRVERGSGNLAEGKETKGPIDMFSLRVDRTRI
ncbi:uncharacterized protein VTP21DRAFT_885 [Calcarisporiella thermophila]|uniref:uncharacterized protein n=1 Tax=Calcarisporiella thermophila TaxID=911321 RepID=UPI003743954B